MRTQSDFEITCSCGHTIHTVERAGRCQCGIAFTIEWPELRRYRVNGHWRFLPAEEIERRLDDKRVLSIAKERARFERIQAKREMRRLA